MTQFEDYIFIWKVVSTGMVKNTNVPQPTATSSQHTYLRITPNLFPGYGAALALYYTHWYTITQPVISVGGCREPYCDTPRHYYIYIYIHIYLYICIVYILTFGGIVSRILEHKSGDQGSNSSNSGRQISFLEHEWKRFGS